MRLDTARRAWRLAAIASTLAFAGFTVWWLVKGGSGLDATAVHFTRRLLRGPLDVVVSDSWPLGEPAVAGLVIAAVAGLLALRGRNRQALLVAGGFAVMSATQLVMLLALAVANHVPLEIDSLSHLYPSGHTARVPFVGAVLALLSPVNARPWIVAAVAVVATSVALDRADSTIQTASVVIGGLLLGITMSAWFVVLYMGSMAQGLDRSTDRGSGGGAGHP